MRGSAGHDDESAAGVFLSHSTADDAVVRNLSQTLGDHGVPAWSDGRELRGGDALWPEIQRGIERCAAFVVIVSPAALRSKWVVKELRHALEVQRRRGKEHHRVIPLLLDGTKLGKFQKLFDEEPLCIALRSAPGGVDEVVSHLLVALGKRLPADLPPAPQRAADGLEELVLELGDFQLIARDGVPRPSARARLVHASASAPEHRVVSKRAWRFVAPLQALDARELRWYLEQYGIWPSRDFSRRARDVEDKLVQWGQLLHDAAMPASPVANVMASWGRIPEHAARRFSVKVDTSVRSGVREPVAREAATRILGLPWELLHDGVGFMFQGAHPTRVRRCLNNARVRRAAPVATPIRILLVTARPEDDTCKYLDHRASALPLVEATEHLGGRVRLHVLEQPTISGLRRELARARRAHEPYHVLHFDGHGVFAGSTNLGGLCFEHPDDAARPERRRHHAVFADELGAMLRGHHIPVMFVEACQTAQPAQAAEAIAAEMLEQGTASVVAMNHRISIETSRRFVGAFYGALVTGARVGDAMLEGQCELKDNDSRGPIFSAGELRLQDWFVPVLFQGAEDPPLFLSSPERQTTEDVRTAVRNRLGELPDPPSIGFIGRSRDLLAVQRMLRAGRYVVIRGQGGEGKTALAAELARWMVRSHQVRRAAFVSVETHSNARAVVDAIGRQLVPGYSVAAHDGLDAAMRAVERVLGEQATLVVVDNMESVLLPPFIAEDTPAALSEVLGHEAAAILSVCERLHRTGDTRLMFTSRETLPAPFDSVANCRELGNMGREDGVKLIERILDACVISSALPEPSREVIEDLVDAVNGHARSLSLLAPALRANGVEATRASLVELMADMARRFPGDREQSLFASVELSLRRLSPTNRSRVRALGAFHGGANLLVLQMMMHWEAAEAASLARELVDTGLATAGQFYHLSLDAALPPYLRCTWTAAEREALTARWARAMSEFAHFLHQQQSGRSEVAAALTPAEIPNLFALLDEVQRANAPEAAAALIETTYLLLAKLERPRLLARVAQIRDAVAGHLAIWNHARFQLELTAVEQVLHDGRAPDALAAAHGLVERAHAAGEDAYPGAAYDLAAAYWLLGRALKLSTRASAALGSFEEARRRFESIAASASDDDAAKMACACVAEQGNCFLNLGSLDQAAALHERSIERGEQLGIDKQVAVSAAAIGTVRLMQGRYGEALEAYAEARRRFSDLGELAAVAASWHQTGRVLEEVEQPEQAEAAYLQALALKVRIEDVRGEASTLNQLANLYDNFLDRGEDAVRFYRRAAECYAQVGDDAGQAIVSTNLGETLRKLGRRDEARRELRDALDRQDRVGLEVEPWKTWAILGDLEADCGDRAAAAAARRQSIASYHTYRRSGGENRFWDGQLCRAVTSDLLRGDALGVAAALERTAGDPRVSRPMRALITALLAIARGSRDPALAEDPDLEYTSVGELRVLLDRLGSAEPEG